MNNFEYYKKNQISSAEAIEIFNKQKVEGRYKSFDEFLASDHVELKFKVGDTVVLQLNDETKGDGWKHNVVFKIMSFDNSSRFYAVKYLMPHEGGTCLHYPHAIGDIVYLNTFYVDRNCELY